MTVFYCILYVDFAVEVVMGFAFDIRNDLALWRGWAVFEAIEARGTTLFHWDDHYARLIRSCLGARIPLDQPDLSSSKDLKDIVTQQLSSYRYTESLVKILVTRGKSENHSTPVSNTSLVIINILLLPQRSSHPLKLEVQNGIREFPLVKLAGGYGYTMIRGEIAAAHGCDDFLFSSPKTGITESSIGNIFFIWNGEFGPILYTPGKRILPGVTRGIILKLATESGLFYRVDSAMASCYALDLAPYARSGECFITSTTYGVHSVGSIVDLGGVTHHFGTGQNTITEKLRTLFLEYREAYFATNGA